MCDAYVTYFCDAYFTCMCDVVRIFLGLGIPQSPWLVVPFRRGRGRSCTVQGSDCTEAREVPGKPPTLTFLQNQRINLQNRETLYPAIFVDLVICAVPQKKIVN